MKRLAFTRPAARLLLCAMLLELALFSAACAGTPAAAAATMHLKKTEGTVRVADGEGSGVAPEEGLGLYSGYKVATEAESYAWIDLDAVKLAKMDAESAVEIVKDGRQLAVNVQAGGMFFNVTEPLAEDETMEIRTSSMLVGIRGTCGWVTQDAAALLEGTVTVTAGEQAATVRAGEMAVLTQDGALAVTPFSAAAVPAFVRAEVAEDEALAAQVLEAAGMDLSEYIPIPRYVGSIERRFDEVLYCGWVDFAGDDMPELLAIGIKNLETDPSDSLDRDVMFTIFLGDDERALHNGSDDHDLIASSIRLTRPDILAQLNLVKEISWSLVEADGRQFLETYQKSNIDGNISESASYYGFDAAGNWFHEAVYYSVSEQGISAKYAPNMFAPDGAERDCDPNDFPAIRAKYSPVKQLVYSPDSMNVTVVAP